MNGLRHLFRPLNGERVYGAHCRHCGRRQWTDTHLTWTEEIDYSWRAQWWPGYGWRVP